MVTLVSLTCFHWPLAGEPCFSFFQILLRNHSRITPQNPGTTLLLQCSSCPEYCCSHHWSGTVYVFNHMHCHSVLDTVKTVRYFYNLKQLISIWIYFKMQFISVLAKLNFSIITPVFSFTWSFRNHSEVHIMYFFLGFLHKQNVQKNSIYLK